MTKDLICPYCGSLCYLTPWGQPYCGDADCRYRWPDELEGEDDEP